MATIPVPTGVEVIAMGHGLVNDKDFPQNLQYTKLTTVGLQECAPVKPRLIPKHSLICANDAKSTICFGDGGSPFISAKTGQLIGIATSSWGKCEFGPQGFTGTPAYIDWVKKIVKNA